MILINVKKLFGGKIGCNIASGNPHINNEYMSSNGLKYSVLHSGGAIGADYEWDRQGAPFGVVSRHYWHGFRTPFGNVQITEADFEEGCRHVLHANRVLQRSPERYMDLLARDWCQVKYADAVYAIGCLQRGVVEGGTGWAVQMAIDVGKPVYLFDQTLCRWLTFENGEWAGCDVPVLTRDFAGIGSRNITVSGIRAIGEVYRRTFTPHR